MILRKPRKVPEGEEGKMRRKLRNQKMKLDLRKGENNHFYAQPVQVQMTYIVLDRVILPPHLASMTYLCLLSPKKKKEITPNHATGWGGGVGEWGK